LDGGNVLIGWRKGQDIHIAKVIEGVLVLNLNNHGLPSDQVAGATDLLASEIPPASEMMGAPKYLSYGIAIP
jgi:hypothetical protein